jgi:exopolysaccharide biosynthesis polyprenyl glycosylphosphotransferase
MIRRYMAPLRVAIALGDALSAAALFIIITDLRYPSPDWKAPWQDLHLDPLVAVIAWSSGWVLALWYAGAYRMQLRLTSRGEAEQVARATIIVAAASFSTLFLLHEDGVSRVFLLAMFIAQPLATTGLRVVLRHLIVAIRARGQGEWYALIVGSGEEAQSWADRIEGHPDLGIRVVGHVQDRVERDVSVTRPILGTTDELDRLLRETVLDEVAICLPPEGYGLVPILAAVAQESGKIVRVPMPAGSFTLPGGLVDDFDGIPVVSLVYGPQRYVSLALKRLFDIMVAALLLILLSPIIAIAALAISAREGRPILFRQERVGVNGRTFTMVKFRTMVKDAESRLEDVRDLNLISGPALQIDDDPRVTPLGKSLRKTSIDELPELWNVLVGQMSIVGPRPAPVVEVKGYDLWHRRRLSMKPGITGLAQIAIRSYRDFDDRARLDLRYIENWSLWMDIKVLVQTIPAILSANGR